MKVLLDTHALVWTTENDPRLGRKAAEILGATDTSDVAVMGMTLLEISMLVSKERLQLGVQLQDYLERIQTHFLVLPLRAQIACEAMSLKLPQGDPFDRVLVATARNHRLPLITRDREIQQSGLVETIW